MTNPTTPAADALAAAVDQLTRARDRAQALAPLRNLIADVDEDTRAAAIAANVAGMTERPIAARLGVAQPTVHAWLAGRAPNPPPGPTTATTAWTLHHIATVLASEVARLRAQPLPDRVSPRHVPPADRVGSVHKITIEAATALGAIAAALDYANTEGDPT